jgi:hypothetical protein
MTAPNPSRSLVRAEPLAKLEDILACRPFRNSKAMRNDGGSHRIADWLFL